MAAVVPLVALVAASGDGRVGDPAADRAATSADRRAVADLLEQIPLGFEPAQDRYDPSVRFVARAPGHTVLLTDDGLAISTPGGGGSRVKITLDGARPDAGIVASQPLPTRSNQFLGDDPGRWQRDVETFGAVSYRQVYPGVDVVFYGRGRSVEHDFVVAPGTDPGVIRLGISGAAEVRLDGNGDLVLPVGSDEIRLQAPVLYQDADGRRQRVEGRFDVRPDGTVGFDVGRYDTGRPLVIDPVVVSASYLGGTSTETAYGIAVDQDGNMVVAGYTESSDFPTVSPTQGGLAQGEGVRTDVFVTKVKADGTTMLWSTYLGGRGREAALAVAVGGDGGVYLTGYTDSADFPTSRALQSANAGGANDVFVARLNSAGSALDYSTYLGGKGAETGTGIALDGSGAAYVVGHTGSADFPTMNPFQGSLARSEDLDGFVVKLQPGGEAIGYSSYLGGGGDDHLTDVAVDGEGSAHVVGDTRAADFPVLRGFQPTLGGPAGGGGNFADGLVAKVKADGSGLVYATFLGGSDSDKATGIVLDGQGSAYVTGNTGSPNFPALAAFQPRKDGDFDAFVTKLKADGNPAYSSFLGGSGADAGEAVAVDAQGRAFVAGSTASNNFPTEKAFQGEKGGGFSDAFVTQIGPTGQALVSSSYLGGQDDDQAAAIASDGTGNFALAGHTNSADFPLAKPFQTQKAGGVGDAFVVKLRGDQVNPSGAAPAASKRDRRVRTLVTITGVVLMAAALQTLWLRRKPTPKEEPEPAPRGDEVEVPGLRYMPRRGRPAPAPTRTGGFAPSEPVKSADWDRRQPAAARPDREENRDEDEWVTVRPKRRRAAPAWDQPQRPLLGPLERSPEGVGVPDLAVPDLWGSDAPLAEAAASVRGGRVPDDEVDLDEAFDDLIDPDRWEEVPQRPRPAPQLDPVDLWGPLVVEQDPEQWADDLALAGLLRDEPPEPASPPSPAPPASEAETAEWAAREAAEAQAAERAEAEAAEWAALEAAEREAWEAAEREAWEAAEREAQEATGRAKQERAEAEPVAEQVSQDAAEVWGPDVAHQVEARAAEVAAAEAAERAAREAAEAAEREARERAEAERAEREAAEAREREEAERATREAAEAAARAEREAREAAEAAAEEERAAAERAALHAAIRRAAEREAMALRASAGAKHAEARSEAQTGHERDEAEEAARHAAELERLARARAEAAQAAQAARAAAQVDAGEAARQAEAAQAEARAASQAAALQAALAAFESAEAEAARIAEVDDARLAAQVAAQVAEAHAARITAQAAAAAQAEAEARARAEAQLEAERRAAEAAEAAARAQADADARAEAAAAAAARAERDRQEPPSPWAPPSTRHEAWSEALADAEAWAEEARLAEIEAAEAAAAAEAAERAEREAARAAEQAELEAAEARATGAPVPDPGPPQGTDPPRAVAAPPPDRPLAGSSWDLSLSELLDEELPIPEPPTRQLPHWDQRRLDQVLDGDFPTPPPAPGPADPVAPPPNPTGLVGGTAGPGAGADEGGDPRPHRPPPPPRLLANVFEPDPDDPLVQSTQSQREEHPTDR